MAQPRKPSKKNGSKNENPLEAAQRQIVEQEAKLKAQMEEYQRLIDEAPKKKEQQQRARREQLNRTSGPDSRTISRATLPDRRGYHANAAVLPKSKKFKAEKHQGRLMFFLLLIVFAGVATWVYFTIRP